jgi:hypothetical protein
MSHFSCWSAFSLVYGFQPAAATVAVKF